MLLEITFKNQLLDILIMAPEEALPQGIKELELDQMVMKDLLFLKELLTAWVDLLIAL